LRGVSGRSRTVSARLHTAIGAYFRPHTCNAAPDRATARIYERKNPMNSLDTRRYEMLVRVREFGAANTTLFPPSTLGGKAFEAVGMAVIALSDHAVTHVSGRGTAREGTASKAVAREALRDELEAIVRTARAMALDSPGVDDKFRLPRNNGDQAMLNAARAFLKDAAPLKADFTKHDMPDDFLDDLQADIEAFEEAIRDHEAGKDTHVAARAGIEAAIDNGLDAVRRLDAIVPNRLRNDPKTLALWERARRVEYRSSRTRNDTAQPAEAAVAGFPE
jgi:hypothetical protein